MLRKQMEQYINKMVMDQSQIELPKVEKEYVEKYELLKENHKIVEIEENARFANAYLERLDKESEELIAVESNSFLEQSIEHLKSNIREFVYMESHWFDLIGVDAICIEMDDLFGTYEALLGLKLQKKLDKLLRDYLQKELKGNAAKFALLFNSEEGLWDLNISLHDIEGFQEDFTIGEAYQVIYQFLFKMVETVEQ